MAAHVPIIFLIGGSYLVPVAWSLAGSKLENIEMVPAEFLEAQIKEIQSSGGIAAPFVSYGYH